MNYPPTMILRHRKENLKKCSLRGLENRQDMQFFTYPSDPLPSLENYLLLSLDGTAFSPEDHDKGLFLIDGTWKYAEIMARQIPSLERRSLPLELKTSYPRKQTGCLDPTRGLASAEALYAAYILMGRNPEGLLDGYYWKDLFIQNNSQTFLAFLLNEYVK